MTVVRLASLSARHLAFKKVTAACARGNQHMGFRIAHNVSTEQVRDSTSVRISCATVRETSAFIVT